MKEKGILFILGFIIVLTAAIGATKLQWSLVSTETAAVVSTQPALVQLTEKGRPDSETMGLVSAPPLQPATHVDRWNPKAHQDSCLACHGKPDTGAPTPTAVHFYDNDTKGKVFRDNCIQCHAQQNETKTKTAFSK
ncbi:MULTISPECIES: nitrate reductase cytochrome c-type subunit [Bacillaceae]|uniref:nitrate reductase cytochrome c-type subunit n=1 Tax=Bacillaceae TaxID=186817 RepID=UPI0016808B09|nr:nitrate reductase cytochrome c-type subunit [Bacillus sp. S3]